MQSVRVLALSIFVAVITPTLAQSGNPLPAQPAVQSSIGQGSTPDSIQSQIIELRKKVDKPPKDAWDKVSALSGLSSGIIVALIGFYATNVYNRRQKITEDRRKDQEILIAQIQTVEQFIPHLASGDEQRKSAALIAIAALGNEDLAVKLATAFKGQGATSALTTIAATAPPAAAASAERALGDMLEFLRPRVVTVHREVQRRATGFVVSSEGLVVTTAHAVRDVEPHLLMVGLPNDLLVPATVLVLDEEQDLALLKTQTEEPLMPLDLSPSVPQLGENVVALIIEFNAQIKIQIGTITARVSGSTMTGNGDQRIEIALPVKPGASGTPVVDKEGRFLGLIVSTDLKTGNTALIPAKLVISFYEGFLHNSRASDSPRFESVD